MEHLSNSVEETWEFAKKVLSENPECRIWLLYGNLASGKTAFTKGFAKELDLDPRTIKSPTFTYVEEHPGLVHYDLYRLDEMDPSLEELMHEHLEGGDHVLIEWPELIEDKIQGPHLKLFFEHAGKDQRSIRIENFFD